jgi:hypothetical protein
MPIEFVCPKCKTLIATPDNSAGQTARCPQCQLSMAVPQLASKPASPKALPVRPDDEYNVLAEDDTRAFQLVGLEPDLAESAVWQNETAQPPSDDDGSSEPGRSGDTPPPKRSKGSQRNWLALSEPKQLASPAPERFELSLALAYGWRILGRNFLPLVLVNVIVLSVLVTMTWALIQSASNAIWLAGLLASLLILWPISILPALVSIRAARGLPTGPVMVASLFAAGWRILPSLGAWLALVFGLIIGWSILIVAANERAGVLVALAVGLVGLFVTLLLMARLAWVPLVACDHPQDTLPQHFATSIAISQGETLESLVLFGLLLCAVVGLLPLVPLLGLPLAWSVVGASYVLMARGKG